MIVHAEGHPKIGLPIVLAGLVLAWAIRAGRGIWPEPLTGGAIVAAFFLVVIGLGVSTPATFEVDRRGRVMPERDDRGRFLPHGRHR